MISVNLLLHLRHSSTSVAVALNGLKVNNGSFVQVIELRVMPVGFRARKVLLISSSPLIIISLVTADHRDIVLDIFQWQIQLQVVRLLRGPLMICLVRGRRGNRILRVV